MTCPQSNFFGFNFDNSTCPSSSTFLACPRQSSFSCCNSSHDKSIRTSYSRCILHGSSHSCCAALKEMSCIACNGEAAIFEKHAQLSWCFSDCMDLLNSCENDFFVSDHNLLRLCQPDDLVCSRLSDFLSLSGNINERIQNSKPICSKMGFAIAPIEDLYDELETCVSVLSIPQRGNYVPPSGCKLANTPILASATDGNKPNNFFQILIHDSGKNVIASISTVLLMVVIFWVFIRRDKKEKRYEEQSVDGQYQLPSNGEQNDVVNDLPSLEELRALRLRKYGSDHRGIIATATADLTNSQQQN